MDKDTYNDCKEIEVISNEVEVIDNNVDTGEEVVPMIECPRCSQIKPKSLRSPHMCVDCEKAENSRYMHLRMHQENWTEIAAESGLDLWVQQPGESQWEYTVWCAFRDSYPGKKPTFGDVAKQLNTTYNVVKKVAQRWTFQIRMQAWMKHCDDITLLQRRQEVLDMNKDHVDMAARLRQKLSSAIERIDPNTLKPSEIASLARLASDMERKARVDTIAQEEMRRDLLTDNENPELKKSQTKQSDLSEVVKILLGAGALGDVTQVGVREVTTKEIVVKDADGNMNSIEMEE